MGLTVAITNKPISAAALCLSSHRNSLQPMGVERSCAEFV